MTPVQTKSLSHLLKLFQTLWTTHGLRGVLQPQLKRLRPAGPPAVLTDPHLLPAEGVQADFTAEAVQRLIQLQLQLALKRRQGAVTKTEGQQSNQPVGSSQLTMQVWLQALHSAETVWVDVEVDVL